MTINTAAARSAALSPIAKALTRTKTKRPANDNCEFAPSDQMLQAALRYFAQHGLGAAQAARMHAKQAFFADDRAAYDWWRGICQTLDRRLASGLTSELETSPDKRPDKLPG